MSCLRRVRKRFRRHANAVIGEGFFGSLSRLGRLHPMANPAKHSVQVIKDIEYDFPEEGDPTITLRAYDKGFKMAGKENQKVFSKPPPGILASEIAEAIAARDSERAEEAMFSHLSDVQGILFQSAFPQARAGGDRGQAAS